VSSATCPPEVRPRRGRPWAIIYSLPLKVGSLQDTETSQSRRALPSVEHFVSCHPDSSLLSTEDSESEDSESEDSESEDSESEDSESEDSV
jgi:hypothetical protein